MGFSYVDYTYPGGHTATGIAQGINDAGQVVVQQVFSYWDDGSTDTRSYIWQDGVATELTSATGGDTTVYAINNAGQTLIRAGTLFIRNSDGTMIPIDNPTATSRVNPEAINNNAEVVGYYNDDGYKAFIWQDGVMTDLGHLPGGLTSRAHDINDSGQVVGYSEWIGGGGGFIWENGVMTNLGELAPDEGCTPFGINNTGQVVGGADGGSGTTAFFWENGEIYNLNDLVDATAAGWTLINAQDINDNGWIVGYGYNPSGNFQKFLLTPEPGTLSLLALGALAALRRRRR